MEVEIGRYLSTEQMLGDSTNHCVPIMDHFRDPIDLTIEYIVMPNLRPFNDPAFGVIGEVVDFVSQVLEVSVRMPYEIYSFHLHCQGMNFMHRHLVAHGYGLSRDHICQIKTFFQRPHRPEYYDGCSSHTPTWMAFCRS
jgi:hypothetical protein